MSLQPLSPSPSLPLPRSSSSSPSPVVVPPTQLDVLITVTFYMAAAISMTLLNKSVLSVTPLPVFLLFCQTIVAVILLATTNAVGLVRTPKFEPTTGKALVPLVAVNVLGLIFNNYCLRFVDASFHQVARGLVLPCTVTISVLYLRQRPSPLSLAAAFVVTSGFFAGVVFDPDHASSRTSLQSTDVDATVSQNPQLGIVFGVASSILSAIHAVLIKRGLRTVQTNAIALSYYNNILSSVLFLPMTLAAREGPILYTLTRAEWQSFGAAAVVTGVFAFLISLAAILSIKITSPVTHMISSAARGVLQTLLAVYIFGDVLSTGRVISIFLIITGSMLYVYAKSEEAKADPPVSLDPERGSEDLLSVDEKR